MIANAATASDEMSRSSPPMAAGMGDPVGDPLVTVPADISRIADAAIRMASSNFRAISSFQAGSYLEGTKRSSSATTS